MRRLTPYLVALALGPAAAFLVACGDDGTDGGIPSGQADRLASDFEDVQQAVDSGRCEDLQGQIGQIDRRLDGFSGDVDADLVQRLRDASDRLNQEAGPECQDASQPDEPEEDLDTQTQTTETQTTTVPPPVTEPPTTTPPEEPPTETQPEVPDPTPPLDDDTLPPEGGVSPEVQP